MSKSEIEIRPVKGFEGRYKVTEHGKIISEERDVVSTFPDGKTVTFHIKERVLKTRKDKGGYEKVCLSKENKVSLLSVHRVVAEAFLPPPLPGQTLVRHKKGDPSLNGKNDVEWGCQRENGQDAINHGTTLRGEKNVNTKLTAALVFYIRSEVANGRVQRDLASELRVTAANINAVVKRKTWYYL